MASMTSGSAPLDRIGRGGSQNILAAALAAGLGILTSIVVARSFSETDTGLYFAATSVVLLIATVARLGTSIGLVYWVARLRHLGRETEIGPLLRMALTPVMVLSVLLAIAMFVLAEPLSSLLLGGGTTAATLLRVLALLLPAVVALDSLLRQRVATGR